jgi:hypothetical protein
MRRLIVLLAVVAALLGCTNPDGPGGDREEPTRAIPGY